MKKYILLLIFIAFTACNKTAHSIEKITDKAIIKLISGNKNPTKGLEKIDSILSLNNSFSNVKTAILLYNKAIYLNQLEKYIPAKITTEKALVRFEKEKNKKFIAISNNHLASINTSLGKNKIALQQVKKAIRLFDEINDQENVSIALGDLARLQFGFKDYNDAIKSLKEAINIQKGLGFSIALSSSYNNLGFILEEKKDFKAAENYYKKAISIQKNIGELNSSAYENLAFIYKKDHKIEASKKMYLEAIKIQEERGMLPLQVEFYTKLIHLETESNNTTAIIKYTTKRDAISKQITDLKLKAEIKTVEDEYQLLAKSKALEQEQNINDKNKVIFMVVLGFLSLLGMFLFQKNRNTKLKSNRDKLVLEQKVLRSQMNPHFIFNALTSIQKNLLEEDLLKSATSLSRFAKLIRQNFEFTSKELIGLDEDLDALKNYIETQQMRFENKFDYEITISKGLDLSYIKIPPLLLQPFVENAIEHGLKPKKEKGKLTINVFNDGNLINFEIIDNGVGYKKKRKETNREHATDIFFNRLKLRKLGEEKTFKISPSLENGKGTKINFTLKL